MKFQKADAFEKHLKESLPDHLSPFYLLLMNDPFERAFLAKRIVGALDNTPLFVDRERLIEELNSPSLFDERRILVCDDIDKLKVKTLPLSPSLILILTGSALPPFFDSVKKEGVTLDLTKEKPWDRKSRLERWLLESVREKNKVLMQDAAAYLLEYGQADFGSLLQELEKAFIYSGEEKKITLEIVKTICTLSHSQSGWQLSEALIWGGVISRRSLIDLDDCYAFIGQLRYQLNLGLALASGGEAPKLSPKKAEKLKSLATTFSTSYFVEGLKELFQLELKMRSGITDYTLLLDYFHAKLTEKRHALSTS